MKPIIFCNIAYMKYYRGIVDGVDEPVNGGKYVMENKDGGECYNFDPVSFSDGDLLFGYVMPPSNTIQLHLEKIIGCKASKKDDCIEKAIVVWCAKENDRRSTRVVGWYKDSNIYRFNQKLQFDNGYIQDYNFTAKKEDCVLLPEDERRKTKWYVPRSGTKGKDFGFGQSNIWYAQGSEDNEELKTYLENIIRQIDSYDGENLIGMEIQ